MGKSYWMITLSETNFHITKDLDFTIQGLNRSLRKRAQRMQPDDRMLYYIEGKQQFAATVTLTSTSHEDHKLIWKSNNAKEDFPYRVSLKLNYVLNEDKLIDAKGIGPRLDYVKKWIPEKWHLAFFGGLHLLPKRDFNLIEDEIRRSATGIRPTFYEENSHRKYRPKRRLPDQP